MGRFVYQVVKHKSGWAYRLEHTYSRVFPTQSDAIAAAKATAREMHEPDDETVVRVETVRSGGGRSSLYCPGIPSISTPPKSLAE